MGLIHSSVVECGVLTVTDTLTRALAAADPGALASAAAAWDGSDVAVRGLASVARHAAAQGRRMYCFWTL